jgi:hypothetical protein
MAATGEIVDAKTVAALLRAAFHPGGGLEWAEQNHWGEGVVLVPVPP